MDGNIQLSIIIPAYNEQDRIVNTIQQTLNYLDMQHYTSQVLVVSDGSTDNTVNVVRGFTTPANVHIEPLEYHPNQGKGYAVRYGMLRGQGQVMMFMDADYAVPIQYVEKGISLITAGYDVAIASRAVSGACIKVRQNIFRQISAKIYTWIQNFYLGISYPDTQCGFKFFTNTAAQLLFGKQKLNSVIFDPEILWLARMANFSIAQFPVEWTHVEDSRIQYDSIGKSIFIFQELLRIKQLHAANRT